MNSSDARRDDARPADLPPGTLPSTIVVTRVVDVTPRMRRVTFGGQGVATYAADPSRVPNIKLVFPDPETGELELPVGSATGRLTWPHPGIRRRVRTYTIRHLDAANSTMDIDFVRHGDEGLAGAWVERAVPGSAIGAAGGGGITAPRSDWYLIVGDETALPAIGRMLEQLHPRARGVALVEIDNPAERQALTKPDGVLIDWLSRDGAPAGTTDLLVDAAAAVALPDDDSSVFAWVAAESKPVLAMRRYLRQDAGIDRKATLVIGYWRKDATETEYGQASDHDRDFDEHYE
ncbi:siderophore-interacting protein [Millisia brevis]|uniref:siderophore-interacting protein n=1 Tax=Millisia brevis TaxID=264148 RepID=UPI00083379DB|nr:siderophore-interacting protein [Millisia brevis]